MATKRINQLDIKSTPQLTDYIILDNGTTTERVPLSALKTLFGTADKTDAVIFYSGNKYVMTKSWENTATAVGDLISKTVDGIDNISSGAIPYYQNSGNGRRCYISSDGHNGNRSIKFVISPYPPDETKKGVQVWNSGFGLGVGSGTTYNCVEGSEVWARVWVKLSPNWSWAPVDVNQSYSTLKIFRVYPFNTYQGELIVQIDTGHGYAGYAGRLCAFTQGFAGGNISLYGGPGGDCAGNPGTAADTPLDTWFCIDAYLKVSATPATAKVIIWRDGVKILEKTGGSTYQTLNRTGTNELITSPGIILFSTWDVNGNQDGPTLPNGEQSMLFDDIVVTNNKDWVMGHGQQDASGNWLVGTNF